ncbi:MULTISPECIES: flagellar protein export ATPase FliI [Virgibacillus]|uniref:ATP synthase n=1 Tax=Virgibacillus pantothenticus TaxID=1473 RepID=A0A0L0QNP5_VIRPA|nr:MULTISPECIES: flagellar protein export ATPase FliI [Virgibacillus]API93887.1 flagellar protein export ATPase FliI [Virgibacillus sp. 6R]KNE20171.1 ATP synthase [Virgibacillus pantothenticus]MBS7427570.1 flagellar protein export ATPase FliI [Virgibacillus sp. 19R1-5]MBU8565940.1 flagellar protein export ATPase FliI [Virgibacillus pantothenticus]MBU8600917.1 flagellar protein export ATPase FliI [Virgibacillus pantothenticus]
MNPTSYLTAISKADTYKRYGKVLRVVGIMIESKGPAANIGEVCYIHPSAQKDEPIIAEVVGFNEERIILMPYEEVMEIGPGCLVESTGKPLSVKIGRGLIGHVIDALGKPLNGQPLQKGLTSFLTDQSPPNPMQRPPITNPLQVGIKIIDALLTVGEGQRIGIFAGSGVGKSTLLGMIARNSEADINVIALIGERGREVREFIEKDLGDEGLKKSIVVVATSDQPALMRIKGADTATAISEYFRDQGYRVNLMMDSVTRVAMARREVGLATGEPPTTKGYTPSVFATLPKLLERTGTNPNGTITAFYTVLVDGDDMNEPIADTVRGILDGHFVMDRKLAERGQYPAINVLQSISRVMQQVTDKNHHELAKEIRALLATFEENRELIQIGAYKRGTDQEIDQAIAYYPKIQSFLMQGIHDYHSFEESVQLMQNLLHGGVNE